MPGKALAVCRTHPFIQGLAAYVSERSLSEHPNPVAARCGVMQTDAVSTRTTLLVLRMRFHLITKQAGEIAGRELLEECRMLAFESSPDEPQWLHDGDGFSHLIEAVPSGNVPQPQQKRFVSRVIERYELLRPTIEKSAQERSVEVLDSHKRVRTALEHKRIQYESKPELPVDLLGVYVYLPKEASA